MSLNIFKVNIEIKGGLVQETPIVFGYFNEYCDFWNSFF